MSIPRKPYSLNEWLQVSVIASIIVFLQFQIGLFRNFPITVSVLALPFVLHYLFSGSTPSGIALILIFSFCLNIIVYFTKTERLDTTQWIQTFLLFILTYYGIYCASKELNRRTKQLVSAVKIAIVLCASFSTLQMTIGFGKINWLDNPFGNNLNLYAHKLDLLAPISRAPGFYIEPSYNALVAICMLPVVALLKSNRERNFYLVVLSIWLVATRSFSGLLTISFILLFKVIFSRKKSWIDALILIVYGLAVSGYAFTRFESITKPGTSAYFRIVSPLKIFTSNFAEYPLGVPLGVRETLVISSDQRLENNLTTSIDNGWLYLLIYFGIVGVIFLMLIGLYCVKLCMKLKDAGSQYWVFGLLPLLTLGFTGGITLPEYILLNAVMISLIRGYLPQVVITTSGEGRRI